MYLDSHKFELKLKGYKWTKGNHKFWLKLCRFITDHGGENIKYPMLVHQKKYREIQWNFKLHEEKLDFIQIIKKDYKLMEYELGRVGFGIIRATEKDFSESVRNTEKFIKTIKAMYKLD